ncbi:uncharacterized protein [Pseudorasbora parva]|uniref:uncharacterized protein n=1 Tax=Pseudorasbora parva TaxID=51549 RepID=UPI00351EF7E7
MANGIHQFLKRVCVAHTGARSCGPVFCYGTELQRQDENDEGGFWRGTLENTEHTHTGHWRLLETWEKTLEKGKYHRGSPKGVGDQYSATGQKPDGSREALCGGVGQNPSCSANLLKNYRKCLTSGNQGWLTMRKHSRGSKNRSSVPIRTSNRFSPLSDAPTEDPVKSALVIADFITQNVTIETPATIVTCLPGARAPDIKANLKVLAKANRKFSKITIHIGTNDVRLHQSEITKISIKEVGKLTSTMSKAVCFSGPLLVKRSDEIVSRLSSLNGWLSKWCLQNNIGFIDNWKSFWGRPDLLKIDGIHPSWSGAALLSSNLAHSRRVEP